MTWRGTRSEPYPPSAVGSADPAAVLDSVQAMAVDLRKAADLLDQERRCLLAVVEADFAVDAAALAVQEYARTTDGTQAEFERLMARRDEAWERRRVALVSLRAAAVATEAACLDRH